MNELAIAGAGLAAAFVLGRVKREGVHPGGLLVPFRAGEAATAACGYLRSRGEVGGVAFDVPANDSPIDTWRAMRDAMVRDGGGGFSVGGTIGGYPAGLTYAQLADVANAWLRAWQAGRDASADASLNFSMATATTSSGVSTALAMDGRACEYDARVYATMGAELNELGKALCRLRNARDGVQNLYGPALPTHTRELFDAGVAFAGALELADYVAGDRVRASDTTWGALADVPGATGAALTASVEATAELAGELVSGTLVAALGKPLLAVLLAGGAYLAWRHFR